MPAGPAHAAQGEKAGLTVNYADLDRDGQFNGRPVVEADYPDAAGSPSFAPARFLNPTVAVTVDTAEVAYRKVLAGAGCSLHRDSVDARLIAELASLGRQGRIVREEEK